MQAYHHRSLRCVVCTYAIMHTPWHGYTLHAHQGKEEAVVMADQHGVDDIQQGNGRCRGLEQLEAGGVHGYHKNAPHKKRPDLRHCKV